MAALDYLTKEVAGAVDRYMSILSHVGYKSYCTVDKLLVYSFIEEILTKFNTAVTEDDYNFLRIPQRSECCRWEGSSMYG